MKKKRKKVYNDIIEFAELQLGESPEKEWDLSTGSGLKLLEERCSRRVYKSTGCGAWLAFIKDRPTKPQLETWRGHVKVVGDEVILDRIGHDGGPDGHIVCRHIHDIPIEVAQYLNLKGATGVFASWSRVIDMGCVEFQTLINDGSLLPDGCEGHQWSAQTETGADIVLRLPVARPKGETKPLGVYGVTLGSIVEGSDAEVNGKGLYFPFTDSDWSDAVEDVEAEVTRIWNETHSCEGCWKLTAKDTGSKSSFEDVGTVEVRADCPECGGNGVVI